MHKIVTIVWRFLPHYRVKFFCDLREALIKDNIHLNLFYGRDTSHSLTDNYSCSWAKASKNRTFKLGSQLFYWLPIQRSLLDSDLIILMQENKILSNYYILLRSSLKKTKIAFWGHGVDFQQGINSLGNRFKRLYSTRVSWWFAYTHKVAEIIRKMGFPSENITVIENAIDTSYLLRESRKVRNEDITRIREELGIGNGPIGLFCGSLYKEKRLDFLLEACKRIKNQISRFEMIFIGEGPESRKLREAMRGNKWIYYVGPKYDIDKIPFFKMAEIFLMPSAVGLAILDCFVFETPIVTTNLLHHGPEIEYLINDGNGIMTENSIESFAAEAVRLIKSRETRERLKAGCKIGAMRYTLENMVNNFRDGIKKALAK